MSPKPWRPLRRVVLHWCIVLACLPGFLWADLSRRHKLLAGAVLVSLVIVVMWSSTDAGLVR